VLPLLKLYPPLSLQLIVWAFDLMPSNAPKTYPELGRVAAGRWGVQAVMLFSFLGKLRRGLDDHAVICTTDAPCTMLLT